MNSLAVAVFPLPATSKAASAPTENLAVPAVPPAPVALVATKLIVVIAAVVNEVVVTAQPVDSIFLMISAIVNPVTDSLKVTVIVAVTDGAACVAVKFPPETTCKELKVTVGAVASITTLAKAVESTVVVPPNDCLAVIEYVPSVSVENVQLPVVLSATNVHVTGEPEAGVAVRVIVAPTVKPPTLIVGVLSLVFLSVLDDPVSDAESSVGALGAARATMEIVRVSAEKIEVSDFPPNSYRAFMDCVPRSAQ